MGTLSTREGLAVEQPHEGAGSNQARDPMHNAAFQRRIVHAHHN